MPRRRDAIVGSDVGDQTQLRPAVPLHSIDEFLAFLAQLEELFGSLERARVSTTGEHFDL